MTILINWGSPQQDIIHLTFQPGWTWEHLKQAIQQADHMIGTVEHTVHLIIDLRGGGVPRDFMSLAGDIFAEGTARPNEGQRVVIGAGLLIRAAYRSLTAVYGAQLANRPFLFANTVDEARALLS
jgi:hypothetical protein